MLEVRINGELYYLDGESYEVQLWAEQVSQLPQYDTGEVLASWFCDSDCNEYEMAESAAAWNMALNMGLTPEI